MTLEGVLRQARSSGRKLLVPYVTGGLGSRWYEALGAIASAGADAIEVGVPFSDPVMDGPTIQEASAEALRLGATPGSVLEGIQVALPQLPAVPVVVMTYYNIVAHAGERAFAGMLAAAGASGAIVPDLPLDELGPWAAAADEMGIATVLLAAPTTTDDRLALICERSRGFVYGVGLLGVTGERTSLAASAVTMAKRLKSVTDLPVLIGIGVSNAEQAVAACRQADGVIVGSAVVRRLLEGAGPAGAADFVGELRRALDEGDW